MQPGGECCETKVGAGEEVELGHRPSSSWWKPRSLLEEVVLSQKLGCRGGSPEAAGAGRSWGEQAFLGVTIGQWGGDMGDVVARVGETRPVGLLKPP